MSDESTKVVHVVQAFAECWNRHDMNAFAELFAADAEFVNVVGLWWRGREEIKKAHEVTHATMFKNSRLTIADIAVGIFLRRARHYLRAMGSFSTCFASHLQAGSS